VEELSPEKFLLYVLFLLLGWFVVGLRKAIKFEESLRKPLTEKEIEGKTF
jgi:hypothetical protein